MSSIEIGKRTDKTEDNPYGYEKVDSIPKDEVCVLYLGGDGTTTDKAANGYAKIIKNEILDEISAEISVYSIKYDFDGHNQSLARQIANIKHRTEVLRSNADIEKTLSKATDEEYNPQYVNELFEKVILPRITLHKGKGKLSVDEACKKIRKLNIVAHCHGAYTALKLEEKMQSAMKELGYSEQDRKKIQSQMLVIAHAPACPLGISKSQFISFKSAYDGNVNVKDNFFDTYTGFRVGKERERLFAETCKDKEGIEKNSIFDLKPCFFAKKQGNLFLIKRKYEWEEVDGPMPIEKLEHNEVHYNDDYKTKEGQLMDYYAKSILRNGIKNSLKQDDEFVPLPPIENLVLSGNPKRAEKEQKIFAKMKQNGKDFREEVFQAAANYHKKMQKQAE